MALKEYTWLTVRLLTAMCATTMFPRSAPADVSAACELCEFSCGPSGCGPWECKAVRNKVGEKEGYTDCKVTEQGKMCGGDTTCKWTSG